MKYACKRSVSGLKFVSARFAWSSLNIPGSQIKTEDILKACIAGISFEHVLKNGE
ncbi:MAG: hypothetical protein JWO09_3741 [Bacteroidetes bacterium]|nr:hypothetical protein [Bacteroidota bacterium]